LHLFFGEVGQSNPVTVVNNTVELFELLYIVLVSVHIVSMINQNSLKSILSCA
jgi:hypothetical protein